MVSRFIAITKVNTPPVMHGVLSLISDKLCHEFILHSRAEMVNVNEKCLLQKRSFCSSTIRMSEKRKDHIRKLIPVTESHRFIKDCFIATGKVPENHAEAMAELLVAADYRGHFSHGMNRLEMYINDILSNCTNAAIKPKILKESEATAWVDGQNGLGVVVGNFCMDLAMCKAEKVGVGWVCAKRSNHYGIASWYTIRAMRRKFIGISMSNTSPLMAPTRSKKPALGTNPLSLAVCAKDDQFILDMATTAVALGKIEIQQRKDEPIPIGWAQAPDGKPTTDAHLAFETSCLMPLGGAENTSGYKGYGLAAVVDILSGVLAGSNYSTLVRKWSLQGSDTEANLGQLFVAVNPKCFAPGFEDRMEDFNSRMRSSEATDENFPVLLHGDKEAANMKTVDEAGRIQYIESQWKSCEVLAKKLNVKPLGYDC